MGIQQTSTREQQLLNAIAREGYKPGDKVSPGKFARQINATRKNCHWLAGRLKRKGMWPYAVSQCCTDKHYERAERVSAEHDNRLAAMHEIFQARAMIIRDAARKKGCGLTKHELDELLPPHLEIRHIAKNEKSL